MMATNLGVAFSAGMLATVNPCAFAMLPSMVSFYLGQYDDDYRDRSLWRRVRDGLRFGALATMGFLLVFVLAGAVVSIGAGAVARFFPWVTVLIGIGLMAMGGWLFLGRDLTMRAPALEGIRRGAMGSRSGQAMFLYGIAYALASLGCTLPIFLIVVGTALTGGPEGSVLLFAAYGLGMGLILTSVAMGAALCRGIVGVTLRRTLPYVHQVSALLLVVAGGSIVWTDVPRLLA